MSHYELSTHVWKPDPDKLRADIRKGEEAIRSFKLLADWLRSHGYEPHRSESNAQFVGRVLREKIGKGGMP